MTDKKGFKRTSVDIDNELYRNIKYHGYKFAQLIRVGYDTLVNRQTKLEFELNEMKEGQDKLMRANRKLQQKLFELQDQNNLKHQPRI
jgi:hypothetical protein